MLLAFLVLNLALVLHNKWWVFDLFTHYIHYYAICAFILTIVSFANDSTKDACIYIFALFVYLYLLKDYIFTKTKKVLLEPFMQLVMQNIFYKNNDLASILSDTNFQNADFLILHEASEQIHKQKELLQKFYKNVFLSTESGPLGFIFASKKDGDFSEISLGAYYCGSFYLKNINLRIITVHPLPGINAKMWHDYKIYYKNLQNLIIEKKLNKEKIIVIGDFNSSPWSFYFQNFLKNAKLKDSRIGFIKNIIKMATWHAHVFFFKIPIDHALHCDSIKINNFQNTQKNRSDHLGIKVDFSLI